MIKTTAYTWRRIILWSRPSPIKPAIERFPALSVTVTQSLRWFFKLDGLTLNIDSGLPQVSQLRLLAALKTAATFHAVQFWPRYWWIWMQSGHRVESAQRRRRHMVCSLRYKSGPRAPICRLFPARKLISGSCAKFNLMWVHVAPPDRPIWWIAGPTKVSVFAGERV